jgi:large subunit ribosomal protein L15
MPVNKRSKYRGSRTCGGGTHKNRRGAGNRGGRGNAGVNAHHFVKAYLVRGPVFGKCGFKHHHEASITGDVLDIGEIDQIIPVLIRSGLAQEEGDTVIFDAEVLGIEKVLGGGKVMHKMNITAAAFSQQAIAKIEAKGGHAMTS